MDTILCSYAVNQDMGLVDMYLGESQCRWRRPHELATLAQDFLGCAVLVALVRDHGDGIQITQHFGEDQWRDLHERKPVRLPCMIAVEVERPECERASRRSIVLLVVAIVVCAG